MFASDVAFLADGQEQGAQGNMLSSELCTLAQQANPHCPCLHAGPLLLRRLQLCAHGGPQGKCARHGWLDWNCRPAGLPPTPVLRLLCWSRHGAAGCHLAPRGILFSWVLRCGTGREGSALTSSYTCASICSL
jgi:hypothetical protein